MKEILEKHGFKYLKDCSTCGGRAETWIKQVGGKTAEITVRKKWDRGVLKYRGSVTVLTATGIENALAKQGLTNV